MDKLGRASQQRCKTSGLGLGGPGFLLSGLVFAPASEIKNSENQKSQNEDSEIVCELVHLRHKS